MLQWTIGLGLVMAGLTGLAVWASHAGVGLERPVKKPVSVREFSAGGGGVRGHGLLVGK